jgi:hypothetical protein
MRNHEILSQSAVKDLVADNSEEKKDSFLSKKQIKNEINKITGEVENKPLDRHVSDRKKEPADFTRAKSFAELYEMIDANGSVRGSAREYPPEELRLIINLVRTGKVLLDSVTSGNGLRETVKNLLHSEPLEDGSLADEVSRSNNFFELRQTVSASDYKKKKEVLLLLEQAEEAINSAQGKNQKLLMLSPKLLAALPEEYGFKQKVMSLAKEVFPPDKMKSRIIFQPGDKPVDNLIDNKEKYSPETAAIDEHIKKLEETEKELAKTDKEMKELDENYARDAEMDNQAIANRLINKPQHGRYSEKIKDDYQPFDKRRKNLADYNATEDAYHKLVINNKTKKSRRDYIPSQEETEKIDRDAVPEARNISGYDPDKLADAAEEEGVKDILARLNNQKAIEDFLSAIPAKPEETKEGKNKIAEFLKGAGKSLREPEVQAQLFKTGVSVAASWTGVKSFYDVPAYFRQRYAVRGNIFGLGHGKNLGDSAEELISASQTRKKAIDEKKHVIGVEDEKESAGKGMVIKAIKDFDKRLAMTREGSEKGSEQRKKLASLLWENRHAEKRVQKERQKEIENILENYTTTKITGVQAAREALNTACVASGAFAVRGIGYLGLSFFEKWEELRHHAAVEADKKGAKVENVGIGKVFSASFLETYRGLCLRRGRNWKERGVNAIKAGGSVARLAGIAMGMNASGHVYASDAHKLIDFFKGKQDFSAVGHNFAHNAERYFRFIPGISGGVSENIEGHSRQASGSSAGINSVLHPGARAVNLTGEQPTASPVEHRLIHEETPVEHQVEKGAAVLVDKNSEAFSYQGGRSVWGELEKQMAVRYKDDFNGLSENLRMESIKLLENRITSDPEAFGLPRDVDFTKMSEAELRAISWDKFFENKEDGAINNLHETLRHPGDKLVKLNGGHNISGVDMGKIFVDQAIDYADQRGMNLELNNLSELAKKFYDNSTEQQEKDDIFKILQTASKKITAATGATSVNFTPEGDINLVKGRETFDLFSASEKPVLDAVESAAVVEVEKSIPAPKIENSDSIGRYPENQAAADNFYSDNDKSSSVNMQETPEGFVKETDWHHPQNISGAFRDADAAAHLAIKSGTLDLHNVASISPEVLQELAKKEKGVINLLGLQASSMNSEVCRSLVSLHNRGGVILNDQALFRVEEYEKEANPMKSVWEAVAQDKQPEVSAYNPPENFNQEAQNNSPMLDSAINEQGNVENFHNNASADQPIGEESLHGTETQASSQAISVEKAIDITSPEKAMELRRFAGELYDKYGTADWSKLVNVAAARKILDNEWIQGSVAKTARLIQEGMEEMKTTRDPEELASIRAGIKSLIDVTERQYGDSLKEKEIFSEPIRRLAGMGEKKIASSDWESAFNDN